MILTHVPSLPAPWQRLSALVSLLWIGACSSAATIVPPLPTVKPVVPEQAATLCASLPLLPLDLESTWTADPDKTVRAVLDTELARTELYRECSARHQSLVDWVRAQ